MIIDDLFPEKGKLVLNANGKEFIERLGIETARNVIAGVLQGENIRSLTEPLTRRRISIATGAMVYLFSRGWATNESFSDELSTRAIEQLVNTSPTKKEAYWPAQWLIGLTGKSFQNVLRSNPEQREDYKLSFEKAVNAAAQSCKDDFGPISMELGYIVDGESKKNLRPLDWRDITYLSTAIGAATLTIRGSEKSTYGKLFERLVMGTVLTILGFTYVENSNSPILEKVFWLSDKSDDRECDATLRLKPGKIIRFDIGFIGKGNPEIMKDKLTRYANEIQQNGIKNFSQTFIIVDKMPETKKTANAAEKSGAEIIQMSMQFWPIELAKRLKAIIGLDFDILQVPEDKIRAYIDEKLAAIPILSYLNNEIERKQNMARESPQLYFADLLDEEGYSDDSENDDEFEDL